MPADPRPRRSRLLVNVTFAFLVASVAPILALGLVTDARLSAQLAEDADARHAEVAEEAERLVEVWLRGVQTGLGELAISVQREVEEERAAIGRNDVELVEQVQRAIPRSSNANAQALQQVQVYSNGEDEAALQGALDPRSQSAPDEVNNWGVRQSSRLVNEPLTNATPWMALQLENNGGALTLPMSVPLQVPEELAPGGQAALVGDVDTAQIVQLLTALAGERYGLRVADSAGASLVDTFPRGADLAAWTTTTMETERAGWTVEVGRPTHELSDPARKLRTRTLLATGLGVVLALVLSLLLSLRITRPIAVLESRAHALSEGDLSARTELDRDDEIGRLSATFDRMAASLEQLDRARSAFVSTVSHELRTPLTSVRLSVANLLDGVHGEPGPAERVALERVAREVTGLERIVTDLLALTRYEAGVAEPALLDTDLSDLALRVTAGFEQEAARRDVGLHVHGEGRADADAALLERALANLVHNAVRHTRTGGSVEVAVGPGWIEVVDQGPGWPVSFDQPSDALEPFARGDASEGHGLGLSIAHRIARLLGAELELADRDDEDGARVRIVFDSGNEQGGRA